MAKYYFVLALVAGALLFYVYSQDPCNQLLWNDFSNKYPGYKILDTDAGEGSPDQVQCHIKYQKPGSDQVYEEVWMYQNLGNGWSLSQSLETQKTNEAP